MPVKALLWDAIVSNIVTDKVAMPVKALLWDAIVSNIVPSELPDDEGLVPGRRKDHVWVLRVGGDLGHPAVVAAQRAAQLQSLSHFAAPDFFSCRSESSNKAL